MLQYSRYEWINEKYKLLRVADERKFDNRYKTPVDLDIFEDISSIWALKWRLESIVTPRNLCVSVRFIIISFIITGLNWGTLLLDINMK